METTNAIASNPLSTKEDEEVARRMKRLKLKELNTQTQGMIGYVYLQDVAS